MGRRFGRYLLVERLASGGMADVWRAQAPGPEGFVKEVALKLIRGDHDARGEFVRMFAQEARLASRLTHANIVQVFDFDQFDGRYYLAMELVRGRTLRDVVDRGRELGVRLGVARAVHVCAELARALAYAHRLEDGGRPAGLVHRDVSPQNVLLSFEGEVKLADFGIARALGAPQDTAPGLIKGKVAYMAPEQARGDAIDARADVFALGAVLWELCAGRRLFARETDAATLAALLAPEPVSPPSAWNEEVPPELDALVLAALAPDPARRTATADALAGALSALRQRLAPGPGDADLRALMARLWPGGASRPRPAEPTAVLGAAPSGTGLADAPTRTAVSGRWAAPRVGAATAALLLVLAGGGAALRARARGEGREARPGPGPVAAVPPRAPSAPAAAPARPAPAATRAAVLVVRAEPWAEITIDGAPAGETPIERDVAPGEHRVAARHPALGSDAAVVSLAPGQRQVWRPHLAASR